MDVFYQIDDETVRLRVEERDGRYLVNVAEGDRWVEVIFHDRGLFTFSLDGRLFRAVIASDGAKTFVAINGETYRLVEGERLSAIHSPGPLTGKVPREVLSSMPGKVLKLSVSEGDLIEVGQELLILEAMKMEHIIRSERGGRIGRVHASAGQMVEPGHLLMEFEAEADG